MRVAWRGYNRVFRLEDVIYSWKLDWEEVVFLMVLMRAPVGRAALFMVVVSWFQ